MSFNGNPKATGCLSHRAIEAAVAFGLPLNEFGTHRSIAMNNPKWRSIESRRSLYGGVLSSVSNWRSSDWRGLRYPF